MKKPLAFLLTGILALSWLVLPVTGCDNANVGQDNQEYNDVFSIYLLAENIEGELPDDLDKLKLQEEPWLSIEDIDYYDYSTHYIYLKKDKASLFGEGLQNQMSSAMSSDFVVVADDERCYLGRFHPPFSSQMPMTPIISDYPGFELSPEDVIHIANSFSLDGTADLRNDHRIREALAQAGKLSLGLSVKLSDVEVNSQDSITGVSYSFAVTNESAEPLYVPDPGKMGASLFHYYTGGISLSSPEVYHIVLSTPYDSAVAPSAHGSGDIVWLTGDNWDSSWFTRLGSHESMERTITFTCDQIVSEGTYSCSFRYTGPSRIEKEARALSDGRLWIGTLASNTTEITTGG